MGAEPDASLSLGKLQTAASPRISREALSYTRAACIQDRALACLTVCMHSNYCSYSVNTVHAQHSSMPYMHLAWPRSVSGVFLVLTALDLKAKSMTPDQG